MFLTWFEYISWFKKKFAEELSEVKEDLNSKWNKIFKKWKTVTAHDYSRGEDDVDDEDDEDDDNSEAEEDEDGGEEEEEEEEEDEK